MASDSYIYIFFNTNLFDVIKQNNPSEKYDSHSSILCFPEVLSIVSRPVCKCDMACVYPSGCMIVWVYVSVTWSVYPSGCMID